MFTATNRLIDSKDTHLDYLNTSAYSGGIDLTQYLNDKKYFVKVKYAMSHITGDTAAMIMQQESSRRYFQRPDNNYTLFDSTRTSMTGHSGTIQIGKNGSSKWRWGSWITWRSPQFETNDVGFLHHSDAIFQVAYITYRWAEPFSIFRNLNIEMDQWSGWDFGINNSFYGGNINTWMQFKNHWSFGGGFDIEGSARSNTTLRGGPSLIVPGGSNYWINFGTDGRKKSSSMEAWDHRGDSKTQEAATGMVSISFIAPGMH